MYGRFFFNCDFFLFIMVFFKIIELKFVDLFLIVYIFIFVNFLNWCIDNFMDNFLKNYNLNKKICRNLLKSVCCFIKIFCSLLFIMID